MNASTGPRSSRASLSRIVEDLGSTLIDLVVPAIDMEPMVSDIVIHDPEEELVVRAGALVLGVGVRGDEQLQDFAARAADAGAAAIVVKGAARSGPQVVDAIRRSGIALLGLNVGVSWNQLAAMLRTLTADGALQEVSTPGSSGSERDLFSLANALTALLDAPVTIEDRNSRVLAFSGRQDEADAARVESILDRQVPPRFTRRYEEEGVFRALYRSDQPVFVPADPDDPEDTALSRVAIAVRASEEILGSIWVAVRNDLDETRTRDLKDAAKLVALEMLRMRAGGHVERRLRADLVGAALTGRAEAAESIERLGLAGRPAVVVAIELQVDEDDRAPGAAARLVSGRERVSEALAMHLSAVSPRSVAAMIGDLCFGIVLVPSADIDADESALRVVTGFMERVSSPYRLTAGLGAVATDAAGLENSRQQAERALRVLRSRRDPRSITRLRDAQIDALMLELSDLVATRGELPSGSIGKLAAYDAAHGSRLVETLDAWLENFGEIPASAASVFTHPNTFRYRLKRVSEIGEIDLTSASQRFAAMIQLRVWAPQALRGRAR
ncbi:PucR family transcriptional regulator [Microbacterium sp. NPDC089695]|uniref:PucR family transcriptional regulator n=1 Tax=Microbacterium sp. NPDC089695 TaxID=3364198 RepID=UPI00380CEEC7